MKKGLLSLVILFLFLFSVGAYAAEEEPHEPVDMSAPKLIVTAYSLNTGTLKRNKNSVLSVTVKNVSKTLDAENVFLSFSCDGVFTDGVSNKYIEKIEKGKSVSETFTIKAAPDAESGYVSAAIGGEFEGKNGQGSSFSNNITLEVEKKKTAEKVQTDSSPRLMVTSYKTEGGFISPEGKTTLSVTVKNMSKTTNVRNIKLSCSDESGEIRSESLDTMYVEALSAQSSYEWKHSITAVNTAAVGTHRMTFTAEYEDASGNALSSSDTLSVDVKQPAKLEYDGASLSPKSYQGETQSVSVTLINSGKSTLYNCKIDFDIKGLNSGGAVFVGEIAAGESQNGVGNLSVSDEMLGKTQGKITITYEDAFGKQYEKTEEVSTTIEKRPEKNEDEEEEEKKKNNLWWLFILIGIVVGGGTGFGITWYIFDKRQRKEDDLRL